MVKATLLAIEEINQKGGVLGRTIEPVVVDGKSAYVLRFISTNNPQAITAIADPVAQSLRIKPGA